MIRMHQKGSWILARGLMPVRERKVVEGHPRSQEASSVQFFLMFVGEAVPALVPPQSLDVHLEEVVVKEQQSGHREANLQTEIAAQSLQKNEE